MREIKFRGLSTVSGEWIYGDLIQRTTDFIFPAGVYTTKIYEYLVEIRPETKSEYTGLKDRNGTEIYEGDILKRGDFPNEKPEFIVRFGQFTDSPDFYHELEYSGWYVERIGEREKHNTSLVYVIEMLDGIVCGNIYEGDYQ